MAHPFPISKSESSPDWADKPEPVPYADLDNPQSLNLYSYVRNNPANNTDATGHDCDKSPGDCAEIKAWPSKELHLNDEKRASFPFHWVQRITGNPIGRWIGMEYSSYLRNNRAEEEARANRDFVDEWITAVMLGTAAPGGATLRNVLTSEEQAEFRALLAKYPEWMPKEGLDTPVSIRTIEENAEARAQVEG